MNRIVVSCFKHNVCQVKLVILYDACHRIQGTVIFRYKKSQTTKIERSNPQSFLGALQSTNANLDADVTPASVNCLKTIYVFCC